MEYLPQHLPTDTRPLVQHIKNYTCYNSYGKQAEEGSSAPKKWPIQRVVSIRSIILSALHQKTTGWGRRGEEGVLSSFLRSTRCGIRTINSYSGCFSDMPTPPSISSFGQSYGEKYTKHQKGWRKRTTTTKNKQQQHTHTQKRHKLLRPKLQVSDWSVTLYRCIGGGVLLVHISLFRRLFLNFSVELFLKFLVWSWFTTRSFVPVLAQPFDFNNFSSMHSFYSLLPPSKFY